MKTEHQTTKVHSLIWLALWLLIFGVTLAWRAQNLAAFSPVNDEGAYLMWARLPVDGYPLYRETTAVQPPLFFEWLGLAFRLGGFTVQAGRWAMLVGYISLALALSWLAHRAGGWLAANVAMLLVGIAPLLFFYSRLVMAEVTATGLATVSLALVFVYLERPRRGWLILSGLILGLSFLFKLLNPFIVAPIGLLLLWRHRLSRSGTGRSYDWSGLLLDGLLFALSLLLPLAVIFVIYDPAALYDQVVAFRGDLRAAIPGSWVDTRTQFILFFSSHWSFWILAFGGIISAVLLWPVRGGDLAGRTPASTADRPDRGQRVPANLYPIVWVVWLAAGGVMLAWHTPLFPHHVVVLLPPLILLGAGFVVDLAMMWRLKLSSLPVRIALAVLLAATILHLPTVIEANQNAAGIVTGGREAEALALLQGVSLPADFLMGDSQLLIFMAGRRTPPPLGDVALVAIKAGRQSSARMIDLTRQYQAPAVVQWSLRLPWLPEYLAWVEQHYLARRVWDNDHIIYFAPRLYPDQTIPNERTVRLGDSLALRGFQLDQATLRPGDHLQLKVFWQSLAALTVDYTVFTQLLDQQGKLVTGWDSQPLGGYFPTSHWPANEIVTDVVQLPVPPDLPPGDYTLITGMYRLETLERLTTSDGVDQITLTTIRVE